MEFGTCQARIEFGKFALPQGEKGPSVLGGVGVATSPPDQPMRGMVIYYVGDRSAGEARISALAHQPIKDVEGKNGVVVDEMTREIWDFWDRLARDHGCIVRVYWHDSQELLHSANYSDFDAALYRNPL